MEIDQKPNIPVHCRLCGNYGDHRFELFDSSSEESSSSLSEKIFRCLDIEVIPSDPTTMICLDCFNKLHGYDQFREVCHATNRKIKKSHQRHHDGVVNGVILKSNVKREAVTITKPVIAYVSLVDNDSESEVAADELVISEDLTPKIERPDQDLDAQVNDLAESSADEIPVFASTSSTFVKHECPENASFPLKLETIESEQFGESPMDVSENDPESQADCGEDERIVNLPSDAHESDLRTEKEIDSNGIGRIDRCEKARKIRKNRSSIPLVRIKKERKINTKTMKNFSSFLVKCSTPGTCSDSFENREAMNLHVKTYHANRATRMFCCHMCGTISKNRANLMKHMNSKHTPVVRFMCPKRDCSKMFTRKFNLNIHINAIHKNEVAFRCPKCSKTFFGEHLLKKHLAVAHGDGIAFVCDLCTKSFTFQHNLDRHIRATHTQKTLFKCPEATCSKSFNQKCNMKRHFNVVHTQKTL